MEIIDDLDERCYDSDDLLHIRDIIVKFIRKHKLTCSESIYQRDAVLMDTSTLVEHLCDRVGYLTLEDDEDKEEYDE